MVSVISLYHDDVTANNYIKKIPPLFINVVGVSNKLIDEIV
jgi:hypothetical protein